MTARAVVHGALVLMLAAGAAASAAGARAVSAQPAPPRPSAPAPLLAAARQLVLVTTPDWDTVRGTLEVFERADAGAWTPALALRSPVTIVVGRSGLAWDPSVVPPVAGPVKREGDGRSPAGVFALGTAFGFSTAADARWLKLPYREVTPTLECVDDAASADYNRLVDRAAVTPD